MNSVLCAPAGEEGALVGVCISVLQPCGRVIVGSARLGVVPCGHLVHKSVGVNFMPPTIERLASLCSLTICCSMPTEPVLHLWPSGFVGGVYQTLRA